MINFDALDFSACRSEEVIISFDALCTCTICMPVHVHVHEHVVHVCMHTVQ